MAEPISQKVDIQEAAQILGCTPLYLRVALQNGKFSEFGNSIKTSSEYTYYINRNRLMAWVNARDLIHEGGETEQ